MNVAYPMVILSENKWDLPLAQEFFWFDNFYYSNDKNFFDTYFLNMEAIDSAGRRFKIVGRKKLPWNLFKNPFVRKWEVVLEDLKESTNIEEFKIRLIELLSTIPYQEQRDRWIEDVKAKGSIRDILMH